MNLDLTKLFNIPTDSQKTPAKDFKGENTLESNANKRRGSSAEDTGIKKLQREIDQAQSLKYQALIIHREYQKNIKVSEQLQTEIIKGLQSGEDIYNLFLKAMKSISLMICNDVQYTMAEQYIREIYGIGLGEQTPLKIELEQVKERLNRLMQSKTQGIDYNQSIDKALASHQNKIKIIEGLIAKGEE